MGLGYVVVVGYAVIKEEGRIVSLPKGCVSCKL